jgi:hypothetical protein
MITKGADRIIQTTDGRTAMDLAIWNGEEAVAELLELSSGSFGGAYNSTVAD